MMRSEKVVAAVDVGTSKTVVAVGKLDDNGQVVLLGCGEAPSSGVIRGEVRNIEAVAKAIDEAACNLAVDEEINEVYVNVSGKRFIAIDVETERDFEEETTITRAEIQSMLQEASYIDLQEDQKVYHIELQGYDLDGEYFADVVGMMAHKLRASYKIFVAQKTYAKNLDFAIAKSCLRTDRLVLDSVSTAEALLSDDEKEAGVVLLEMGASLTKLSIYTDSVLRYQDALPFAGSIMTNDLKDECTITLSQAEKLKTIYGKAIADKTQKNTYISIPSYNGSRPREINMNMLAAILQSRLDEFADWASLAIEKSGYADELNAGMVLTGGTAQLQDISTLFKYRLGLDVRIGYPRVCQRFQGFRTPAYASVFGLLQIGLYEIQEELLAPKQRMRKNKSKQRNKAKKSNTPGIFEKFFEKFSSQAELFLSEEEGDEIQ
ncbi:MAG: cell division protein FtsA [Mangrovibacterium sp.]